MSNNIFDQLMELLNQPGPVNWKLAEQIAKHVTGPEEPIDPWLADEYIELTRLAQFHISQASELPEPAGAVAVPVDRSRWADANLRSFRYLVEPMADKLADMPVAGGLEAMLGQLAPALLGMQMGAIVGFLSQRVLGQFDLGLPAADGSDIYYLVPNIEAFARDHDLDAKQVRLWVALHEVTHHAQFAVEWVRPYFIGLIRDYLDHLDLDPSILTERIQDFTDPAQLQSLLDDSAGLAGLVTSPEQRPKLDAIQAFMAAIEGYSDYLMDRAAPGLLPDIDRMRAAIRSRREEMDGGERILDRLLGIELKREQYRLGAAFFEQVVERWGQDAVRKLWTGPENLPTIDELDDPLGWAARVLLEDLTEGF